VALGELGASLGEKGEGRQLLLHATWQVQVRGDALEEHAGALGRRGLGPALQSARRDAEELGEWTGASSGAGELAERAG
jgi:hypothetical protein